MHEVLAVPGFFTTAQRQATRDAGAISGLNFLGVISDTDSIALAYGMANPASGSGGEHHVLIYDLGGGTVDASIVTFDEGIYDVKVTSGNSHCGGEDFTTW